MGGGGRFEVKGCLKASDPSGLSSSPSFPLDGILVFRRFPPPPPRPYSASLVCGGMVFTGRGTLSKFCPSGHAMRFSGADIRQLLNTVFGFEIPFSFVQERNCPKRAFQFPIY